MAPSDVTTKVADADLPALFRAADQAALEAQKAYLRLIALDLSVMIVGATLTALSGSNIESRRDLAITGAICMAIAGGLTLALKSERYSATWYDGRAVAESVKTIAWRYMVNAEPYSRGVRPDVADGILVGALEGFLAERTTLAGRLPSRLLVGDQITDTMKRIRALPVGEAQQLYLDQRIHKQRIWYAERASMNNQRLSLLSWLILAAQTSAIVAAVSLVSLPELPLNFASVFAAIAAAMIAWSQVNRHDDLATAYGLTAQELATIEVRGQHVSGDAAFSDFVLSAESAISREHTLWLAKQKRY